MVRQRVLSATLDGGIVELESCIRSLPKEEKRSNATKPKGCLMRHQHHCDALLALLAISRRACLLFPYVHEPTHIVSSDLPPHVHLDSSWLTHGRLTTQVRQKECRSPSLHGTVSHSYRHHSRNCLRNDHGWTGRETKHDSCNTGSKRLWIRTRGCCL